MALCTLLVAAEDKPKTTNRLARETSPYLLLHAHNPVDWYPWGPEAFAKAKKEGKLVFLSIGYSSCYWCHVMERESFQNDDVAKLMNQQFVCVKVDREERPDIDSIYMTALNVLGQRGGWPLSMFLTADGKPIVGGTYWPPEDRVIDERKVRGFKSILQFMHSWHKEKPQELLDQADHIAALTRRTLSRENETETVEPSRRLIAAAVDGMKAEFDPVHGGFGSAANNFRGTKFPVPPSLMLLLEEARRTKSAELTNMVTLTLEHMARGGIYDQVGGGFHRYSTERTWTVPHFEKMLYDNAQLVEVYAKAYSATRDPLYERVVRETLEFVSREMTSPEGGFYSALDAETEGEEGRYYVWTSKELEAVFPDPSDLAFAQKLYGADTGLNFENKYHILTRPRGFDATSKDLETRVEAVRQKLYHARARRARPLLDTKALTSWNGQMIAGYAVAGKLLADDGYTRKAAKAADFVLTHLRTPDGRLLRTYGARPGQPPEAKINGYLDDYAYLIHGLLCLHDATNDPRWLEEAKSLTDTMVKWHHDADRGGFYYTSHDHEALFVRAKDQYDSVQPSGNSTAAGNLVQLWIRTGDERYKNLAEKTFRAFAGGLKSNPTASPALASALAMYLDNTGDPGQGDEKKEVQRGAKKSESMVKIKTTADKIAADGQQHITLTLAIEPGWHLYANPLPEDFPGIPVTVNVEGNIRPKETKIEYPPGTIVKDALAGDYGIYEKEAVIKVRVKREPGDTEPLDISVKVQACTKKSCLAAGVVRLTVR
jgi:uncharacterized protein YyaL (SSP411 family)